MRCAVFTACLAMWLGVVQASHPLIYTNVWPSLNSLSQPAPIVVPNAAAPLLPTLYAHGKQLWRDDGRCGDKITPGPEGKRQVFLAWPGGPVAQCNPNSLLPCCSAFGYCGAFGSDSNGFTFCSCPTCEDYRPNKSSESDSEKSKISREGFTISGKYSAAKRNTWTDSQCRYISAHILEVAACQAKCLGINDCTAVNHRSTNNSCVLYACGFPVPEPTDYQDGVVGYNLI